MTLLIVVLLLLLGSLHVWKRAGAIIGVISRQKSFSRLQLLCETWVRDTEVEIYVFLGGGEDGGKKTPPPCPQLKFVWLEGVIDDRYPPVEKVWEAVRYFYPMSDHSDWIVIVDDDTLVFPKRLMSALIEADATQKFYIGQSFIYPNPAFEDKQAMRGPNAGSFTYAAGGAGYGIHSHALQRMALADIDQHQCERWRHSDVTIGKCLLVSGIPLTHVDGFYNEDYLALIENTDSFILPHNHVFHPLLSTSSDSADIYTHAISIHHINSSDRFRHLYEKYR